MTKVSKRFFLTPAISFLRVRGDREAIASFKEGVCQILGWSVKTWYKIQSVGVVDLGQPQYEAISELMQKYGIAPEQGWGIREE